MATSVLFVCLGNICRSPTAHGVFQSLAQQADSNIIVDSAGTGSWHIGRPPDKRATATALSRGYDLRKLRARQVSVTDFDRFDYILAMDRENLANLKKLCPSHFAGCLDLFLAFGSQSDTIEVPDPYTGDLDGFESTLDLIEDASAGLLNHIKSETGKGH